MDRSAMPADIKNDQHRKIVLKMTIEIVVTFCKAYFDGDKPADRVNDMLIGAAILVGQVEGRPLNASKIAQWVGMARPTVIRRLSWLEQKGVIERKGTVFKMRHDVVNSDSVVRAGLSARRAISTAYSQLSKLDTLDVAEAPNRNL